MAGVTLSLWVSDESTSSNVTLPKVVRVKAVFLESAPSVNSRSCTVLPARSAAVVVSVTVMLPTLVILAVSFLPVSVILTVAVSVNAPGSATV